MQDMAGNKKALDTKVDPLVGKIREIYPPVLFAFIHMRFEDKAIYTVTLPKEALVILTIVFIRDAGVVT